MNQKSANILIAVNSLAKKKKSVVIMQTQRENFGYCGGKSSPCKLTAARQCRENI